MTTFTSPIKLGEKYRDKRFGMEGYATAIFFNTHGCVEVYLQYNKAKEGDTPEIERHMVNELLLVNPDGSELTDTNEYVTEIVQDRKYEDVQTGIQGHAAVIEFWEHMSNRVSLRSAGKDKDGIQVLKYHSIDDFLLRDLETKVVAKRQDEKRSPVTQEVTYTR